VGSARRFLHLDKLREKTDCGNPCRHDGVLPIRSERGRVQPGLHLRSALKPRSAMLREAATVQSRGPDSRATPQDAEMRVLNNDTQRSQRRQLAGPGVWMETYKCIKLLKTSNARWLSAL